MFLYFAKSGWRKRIRRSKITAVFTLFCPAQQDPTVATVGISLEFLVPRARMSQFLAPGSRTPLFTNSIENDL